MKIISQSTIEQAVFESASKMCFSVDEEVQNALKNAFKCESGFSKDCLKDILDNVDVAKEKHIPVCQDTGIVIAFVNIGNFVHVDGDLYQAINNGIRQAYKEQYLRKSVVSSPIKRENTNDNTPAVFHTEIVSGDQLKITLCPKGAGSENMGAVKMLTPASGIEGIENFVVDTVKRAGGKACPPVIVGVGIGGTMEKCAILSKQALLRPLSDKNPDATLSELENRILERLNNLGMGAMGLKGKYLALGVKINVYPCHIASLPVAVSIMCHASRHSEIVL